MEGGPVMACRTPQQVAEDYLTGIVEVWRGTRVPDGAGGSTVSYTLVASVPCRRSVVGEGGSAVERAVADRLDGRAGYRFRVPLGTDVQMDDRVVCGGVTAEVITATSDGPTLRTFITVEV